MKSGVVNIVWMRNQVGLVAGGGFGGGGCVRFGIAHVQGELGHGRESRSRERARVAHGQRIEM